jgi:hypothetical protein
MAGIEITHQWIDLEEYARLGQEPACIISRGREEEWQVAKNPIVPDRLMEWGLVKDGDAVYVPLVPYRLTMDPEGSFAFLMEIGVLAGIQVSMTRGPVRRIHLIRGRPVEDLRPEADAFRFWVGMAIRIK